MVLFVNGWFPTIFYFHGIPPKFDHILSLFDFSLNRANIYSNERARVRDALY